jgi:hypothetical protein
MLPIDVDGNDANGLTYIPTGSSCYGAAMQVTW